MERLQDILGKKAFQQPDEMTAIKDYVLREYKSKSQVKLQNDTLIVRVPSSALAATLQLKRLDMIKACGLKDKKLVISVGQ